MREILFRGKRIDNGEWVEGDVFVRDEYAEIYKHVSVIFAGVELNGIWQRVNLETVCQYTGLTDKNGVKIFEGDIVHVHDITLQCTKPYHEFDGYIDYADGSFRIVSDLLTHYRWIDYEIEVIGNIHDNPELIGCIRNV